jgi:hypothetical protein
MTEPDLFTLHGACANYMQSVVPPDAPAVQRTETQRAFHAGAWAVLTMLTTLSDAQGPDAGAALTLQLIAECQAFVETVRASG